MASFLEIKNQLPKILKKTEKRYGRADSKNWKNKDFENLSFEINRETKILISPATLKRLFGKVKTSEDYTPQEITIKALKEYSGFTEEELVRSEKKKRPHFYFYLVAATLIPAVLASIFFIGNKKTVNSDEYSLELLKVEGHGPATAFFTYSAPANKDSIFLDFGDETAWSHIRGTNRTQTHFYGIPGVLNASIRTRQQRLTPRVKVFVPTTGWKALAYYFDEKRINRYYPVPFEGNIENGVFHASRKSLAGIGLDSTKILTVQIDNYTETHINGDSFSLQSRFKNDSFWPGVRCYSVYFTIQGTNGRIIIKFVGEGCSGYGEYILGEKTASGSGVDLSGLAINLNKWSDIEIRNENKTVSVSVAGSLVFKESYQNSIGEILGTTIKFHGSGAVDYVYLKDKDNTTFFEQDF